jgi:transposase
MSSKGLKTKKGIFPSRHQSDEVDHPNGAVARNCNRRLRGAALLVAKNLVKCHPYYRGLSALMAAQKVTPLDRQVRIANRAMRMVFQIVGGRQVWRGKGVNSETILDKIREFHRVHNTPIERNVGDIQNAVQWLPKSSYASEAKPIQEWLQRKVVGRFRSANC